MPEMNGTADIVASTMVSQRYTNVKTYINFVYKVYSLELEFLIHFGLDPSSVQ